LTAAPLARFDYIGDTTMTREEFLLQLDEVLELPAGSLRGPEKLEDLEHWDSSAMIGFIALADDHNGKRLSPRQIVDCATVDDLLRLAQVPGGSS
jgi:acyl carrier protein